MSWKDPAARPAAVYVPLASRSLSPGICGSMQAAVPRDVLAQQAGCGSGCSHSPGSCLFLAVGAHTPAACVWWGADAADGCSVRWSTGSSWCWAGAGAALQIPGASPASGPSPGCLLRGAFGATSTKGSALFAAGGVELEFALGSRRCFNPRVLLIISSRFALWAGMSQCLVLQEFTRGHALCDPHVCCGMDGEWHHLQFLCPASTLRPPGAVWSEKPVLNTARL